MHVITTGLLEHLVFYSKFIMLHTIIMSCVLMLIALHRTGFRYNIRPYTQKINLGEYGVKMRKCKTSNNLIKISKNFTATS